MGGGVLREKNGGGGGKRGGIKQYAKTRKSASKKGGQRSGKVDVKDKEARVGWDAMRGGTNY